MAKARISLSSIDVDKINQVCHSIKDIADKTKTKMSGPVTLPTKRLKHTTRKTPCGNGKASFDNFEMRIHKRLIDIHSPSQKTIDLLTNLNLPAGVDVEIKM